MKKYIAIDIGGTAIKYGMINELGQIIHKNSMPTESYKGGFEILKKTIQISEKLITQSEQPISGICISTAGMVDTQKGSIFYASPLIPDYAGTEFKKTLEEKFRIPCEVENDVNCAGLAESRSGAAKGYEIACMLTIGTGIGGCIILNGNIFHGGCNSACEIGYMHMDESDFQTLGAASILTKKVADWKKESEGKWDGYHIFAEARNGDALCIRAINEMTDVLGKGIANICYVLNPQVIVLGGGIMAQEEILREKIHNAVQKYLVWSMAAHTQILFAKHKNDAGMLGAYYHFSDLHKM